MNPARGIGLRNIGERREPAKVISPMDALRRSVETERKPVEGHQRRTASARNRNEPRAKQDDGGQKPIPPRASQLSPCGGP
jgi:hypothetical protein